MKKLSVLIISVLMILSMIVSASAATPAVEAKAAAGQVKVGESVVVTLSFSDLEPVTSAYVSVTVPADLELVPGECKWLKDGFMKDFSGTEGTIAFTSATDLNGDALQLVFKGKTASAKINSVKIAIQAKNGAASKLNTTASAALQVICAEHTFGEWSETKAANCTEAGNETRQCSVCKVSENKEIPALGHKMGDWTRTKEPTCTAAGQEERSCTNAGCTYKETRSVKALGHKYGSYTVTKEATCAEKGVETATCSVCGAKTTRDIEMKEHTYGDPVVVTPATETEVGKMKKTCTVCGHELEEEIPMVKPVPTEPTKPSEAPTQPTTKPTSAPNADAGTTDNQPGPWRWIIFAAVALVAVVVIVILIKKRRY